MMTALAAGIALLPLVSAAEQPGKEILHPVAVVITGGLFTSVLLDFLITPAAFWLFGRKAAHHAIQVNAPATH
jgi:Cu/Ag efflux pump CusA